MSKSYPYLDPLTEQFLRDNPDLRDPPPDISVKDFRDLIEKINKHKKLPGVERKSFVVPVEGGVKTWIYKPEGTKEELPFIFYLHGGGWLAGSINSYDSIVTDIVLRTGFAVLFPEYTLSPEVTFPTQEEECFAVLKWVTQHGKTKGLSPSTFAVVGDSAGGQLTAGINIMWQQRKQRIPILFNILISPLIDADTTNKETPSEFRFFDGPLISVPITRRAIELYIPDKQDRLSEIASPINITDAHARRFSRTLIIVSSADPLRSEGEDFGRKLQRAGADCAIVRAEGQIHDSVTLDPLRTGPTPQAMMTLIAAELRLALGGSTSTEETNEAPSRKRRRRV